MSYYTIERFNNWVERIRDINIDLNDAESLTVFDRMVDDFVVACLNVIKAVKDRELTKKEAVKELKEMEKILMSDVKFEESIKNEFFEFIREGLKAVIRSAIYCVEGKVSKKNFSALIKDALKKEQKGDVEGALDTIARMGAKVFKGEKLPEELEVPEDSIIINWLDGIEAINATIILTEIDSSEDV